MRTAGERRRELAAIIGANSTSPVHIRRTAEQVAFLVEEFEKTAAECSQLRLKQQVTDRALADSRQKQQATDAALADLRQKQEAADKKLWLTCAGRSRACAPSKDRKLRLGPRRCNLLWSSCSACGQRKAMGGVLFTAAEKGLSWSAGKAKIIIATTVLTAGWEAFRRWGLRPPPHADGRRWSSDPSPEERREQIEAYVTELAEKRYHGGIEELRVLRDCAALHGDVRFVVLKTHGPDAATDENWFEDTGPEVGSGPNERTEFPTKEIFLYFHSPTASGPDDSVVEGHFDTVFFRPAGSPGNSQQEQCMRSSGVDPVIPPEGTDYMRQALRACQEWQRSKTPATPARAAEAAGDHPTAQHGRGGEGLPRQGHERGAASGAIANGVPGPDGAGRTGSGEEAAGFRTVTRPKAQRVDRQAVARPDDPAHGVVIWNVPNHVVEEDLSDLSAVRVRAQTRGINIPESARLCALENRNSQPRSYRVVVHLARERDVQDILDQAAQVGRALSWSIRRNRPGAERVAARRAAGRGADHGRPAVTHDPRRVEDR